MPRTPSLVLTVLLAAAACSEPAPAVDPRAGEIARLAQAVEDLRASEEELSREVRRQARQLASLGRVRPAPETRETGSAGTSPTGIDDEDVPTATRGTDAEIDAEQRAGPDAETVAAVLDSEPGQQAIRQAAEREVARREERERRLYVSYQVGVFARRAGLDERQTERLQEIWKGSLDRGVALREQFAAIGQLPESEREEARERAMQSMRDIGRERNERVAEILNGPQLEMYEQTEKEIVDGLHGGRRR